MTFLTKKIKRETATVLCHRPVIIEIEPPGWITLREKGTRTRWSAPATLLMQIIIQRTVEAKRLAKKKTKRVKR